MEKCSVSTFDRIKVFDGILHEQHFDQAQQLLERNLWGKQTSKPGEHEYKQFWIMRLEEDKLISEEIYSRILEIVGKDYKLVQVYANGQTTGQDGVPHNDSDDPDTYTFLIYMNSNWDALWGGKTVFMDATWNPYSKQWEKNSDDIKCFFPRPNLGLFFPSNILHFAEAPTRDFYGMRVTIAYKLKKV